MNAHEKKVKAERERDRLEVGEKQGVGVSRKIKQLAGPKEGLRRAFDEKTHLRRDARAAREICRQTHKHLGENAKGMQRSRAKLQICLQQLR